ncbi:MAG: Gfo/Idh/MocA family oxidoreductase [Cytophagales bacterium]|nr:Gfo/Idh/MocA family oxidoreductase [Armatimonadota bacterium]
MTPLPFYPVSKVKRAVSVPSASPHPRLGLLGCGVVGDLHRERLLAEGVEITAICDPDSDALARMAGRLPRRPRLFRSELDLLAAGLVDAVVVCTPHATHERQIRAALGAGVHILSEKPFVTDTATGAELVAEARRRGLALFVSYTRRSRGHARFLLGAAGRIGPLQQVIISRAQPWYALNRRTWRMHLGEGGGFLVDAGASMLDLLLRMVDYAPVTHLNAELVRARGEYDADTEASLRLEFRGGAIRTNLILLGDTTEQVERIQLYGERGTAGWMSREDQPHDLYVRPDGGPSEAGNPALYRVPSPDAAFVAALRSGRGFGPDTAPDLYDAASALPVVGLVERIYQEAVWR